MAADLHDRLGDALAVDRHRQPVGAGPDEVEEARLPRPPAAQRPADRLVHRHRQRLAHPQEEHRHQLDRDEPGVVGLHQQPEHVRLAGPDRRPAARPRTAGRPHQRASIRRLPVAQQRGRRLGPLLGAAAQWPAGVLLLGHASPPDYHDIMLW